MLKKILVISIWLLFAKVVFAASPELFYSDLTSGPKVGGQNNKGVYVTIKGKNFGFSQGSSYVTIGGGQADNYPLWTDTKIAFQLGANAASGNITITTSEGTSNGVSFAVRAGNIYFVNAGSPNNPGTGTFADPWRSPASYYNAMIAGDTCYIRAGNYANTQYGYPGWHACVDFNAKGGTADNPIAWVGYPGETATFTAQTADIYYGFRFSDGPNSYITIANFNIASNSGGIVCLSGASGVRVINNTITLTPGVYASIHCGGNGVKVLGNEISGSSGGNQLHGIYVNSNTNDFEVGWNYLHDNTSGAMIQVHNDTPIVAVGTIHDNTMTGANQRGITIDGVAAGSSIKVYNNLIYNCGASFAGIKVYRREILVYNNTLYGVSSPYGMVLVESADAGTTGTIAFKNNIFYATDSTPYMAGTNGGSLNNVIIENNNYYGNGNGPAQDAHAINANPQFYDAGGGDFHLQSGSPAMDTGANVSSVVATDFDGLLRPQGTAFDIGAYEYASGYTGGGGGGGGGDVTPPAAISNLSISSQSDTSVTLTWTSPGNDGNTGAATSYDIRYSLTAITDSNFASATQVSGAPVPLTAGTVQSVTKSGLQTGSLYYFAMKSSDSVPNTSAISNTVSATPRDITPPAAVTNLGAVTGSGDGQIVANWTAPGDDGTAGRATTYDLRYSTANITSTNWVSAAAVPSLAAPKVAGSAESVTVSGLLPGTLYYFALKTSDEASNISSLSNVPSARSYNPVIPDTTAPAAITGMSAASGASNGTAVLNWIATGDDGTVGTATSYEIRYSRNAINSTNWSSATKYSRTTLPVPKISGQRERFVITGLTAGRNYYFAIKAKDNVGLFSAISNVPTAVAYNSATDTILPGTITDLSVANTSGNEVTLTWTAPGGDGQTGTCASYEIRYSTSPVSNTNFTSANFLVALAPQSVPIPNSAGFTETTTINNLSSAQSYYFGIKSYDGVGHVSALSNVASIIIVVQDTIAPVAVTDLAASPGEAMGSIIIGWTAPGNDGSTGQANSYTIKYATFTISDTNFDEAVSLATAPIPDMAGIYQTAVISDLNIGTQYYVAMKAADLSGNISAISNIAEVLPKTNNPPGNITDLASVSGTNDGDIVLSWTAPTTSDGSQISSYEIKYSTNYIFEVNLLMIATDNQIEWSSAPDYPIKPTPAAPGVMQTFICTGLKPNESYYFAVKSYDAEGNASVISNVSQALAGNTDFTAPSTITDLQAENGSGAGEVILTWTASGDDGLVGTAASYTIKYASASINDTNWDLASVASNTLAPKFAGNRELFTVTNLLPDHQYFFAIKTVDEVGNVSDVSNSPEIRNEAVSDLDKVRSSPNPWKKASGGMIAISHLTPGAKVKIFNLAGEMVRELEEQNGVALWDAKNEDGQEVASGIYMYYASDGAGHEKTGKMAIIK